MRIKNRGGRYNEYLLNSIIKSGFSNFEVTEVYDYAFSPKELNIKEKVYIEMYRSYDRRYGYNFTTGGENRRISKDSYAGKGIEILCLNDGKVFKSMVEASSFYNIPHRYVKKNISMKESYYSNYRYYKYFRFVKFEKFKNKISNDEKICACCAVVYKKTANNQKLCLKCRPLIYEIGRHERNYNLKYSKKYNLKYGCKIFKGKANIRLVEYKKP